MHSSVRKDRTRLAPLYDADILIAGMDARSNVLIAADGRRFHEVNSNIWKVRGEGAAYLGTGRHGGGITLRLLFVKDGDAWYNVETGRPAPFASEDFDV